MCNTWAVAVEHAAQASLRWLIPLLALPLSVACKQPAPTPNIVAITPSASTSATTSMSIPVAAPNAVITRWNDAHVAHDSAALSALYADTVYFYGKKLSRAECVKHKVDAFAKAPDYGQSFRDLALNKRGDRWVATLTKVSTTGGKSTDYPSVLYLDEQGRITAEMDKPDEHWCVMGEPSKNIVMPPFTVSPGRAESHLLHSSYTSELGKQTPPAEYYGMMYTCPDPTECPSGIARTGPPTTPEEERCFFKVRLGAYDPNIPKMTGGTPHQWFDMGSWIDGVSDVLWYQNWTSDALDAWHRDPK